MLPRRRGKVLVVDDDPIILEVVRERLDAAGFDVYVRADALGTSQWVAREQPDFILLDVMMPALGGAELGLLLKRSHTTNQTAVILHSSMTAAALAARDPTHRRDRRHHQDARRRQIHRRVRAPHPARQDAPQASLASRQRLGDSGSSRFA